MKNITIFYPIFCHFLVVKFSAYLNRHVFVMNCTAFHCAEPFIIILALSPYALNNVKGRKTPDNTTIGCLHVQKVCKD